VVEVEVEAWVVRVGWVLRDETAEGPGELHAGGAGGHVREREERGC
jgi:hypothetical protein